MIVSPLRYPGGKAKLFPFFAELIRKNALFGSQYCEPYAGGGGLAIRLLTSGFVDHIHLNDIDKSIFAFWTMILQRPEEFCRLIAETPISIEEWYRQREIWGKGELDNPLALGFSAYFLNRTNRSGIIEGAGPIGGYSQSGTWKLDVRLVKSKQIANIRQISRYAPQISISNFDALAFLDQTLRNNAAFTYLDPPYYVKGKKLYKNFYEHDDHEAIATRLSCNRSMKWIVSYDDVPQIRELYHQFEPISYALNYSAGTKTIGSEVIFLSDQLKNPAVAGFSQAA